MSDTREWVHVPPRPDPRFFCLTHNCVHAAPALMPECVHIQLVVEDDIDVVVELLNGLLAAPPLDDIKKVLWGLATAYDGEWGSAILSGDHGPPWFTAEKGTEAVLKALNGYGAADIEGIAKWLTEGREGWS